MLEFKVFYKDSRYGHQTIYLFSAAIKTGNAAQAIAGGSLTYINFPGETKIRVYNVETAQKWLNEVEKIEGKVVDVVCLGV
jgi:hypothetical protein